MVWQLKQLMPADEWVRWKAYYARRKQDEEHRANQDSTD